MATTKAETVWERLHCQAEADRPRRHPLPKPAAELTVAGRQHRGSPSGGCVCAESRLSSHRMRPGPARCLWKEESWSRNAATGREVVDRVVLPAAERHCQAHGVQRAALWALKWQVRTCVKQPIVGQKATRPRSVSVEGREVKPRGNHGARSRWSRRPSLLPRGAAKLTIVGGQHHRPWNGRCVCAKSSPTSGRKRLAPA